ncbi:ammonia-dependent NAD(+) synthetase [Pseudomonas entomophila]|uniref:ammonia-dependent NAD(+) synthetase n=1 Tax=Pseudomonas entomophila TaxID=312306 RepID=UPI003EB7168F
MQASQQEIIQQLKVQPPFADDAALETEITRRVAFIKQCLGNAGLKALVLGISGGVDSLTGALLAQRAVRELREETGDAAYRFIAVRLPYHVQQDEHDAQACLDVIKPDEVQTVDIAPAVRALVANVKALDDRSAGTKDFVVGNTKARMRMVAQYTIAGACQGLVIGTDHAAEAVMGFYTKFGDGACDLAPLSGLVKRQVRAMARVMGAPANLVEKVPTADLEDLEPGKPDEAAHGVTYAEIDDFLHGKPVSDAVAEVILSAYRKTQHKRELPFAP